MRRWWGTAVLAVSLGTVARPQEQPAATATNAAQSDLFERACIDLMHQRTPEGDREIVALQDACAKLMQARAEGPFRAERERKAQELARQQAAREAQLAQTQAQQPTQSNVQPGRSTAPAQPGESALAAFTTAGAELVGTRPRKAEMGYRSSGPVHNTFVTNPFGWFTGVGVNAELTRSLIPKASWVAGAHYSATDATNGSSSSFGIMGGLDAFLYGQQNEGLRLGPRLELAIGRQSFGGADETFTRLGLSGEGGYNFIASNGITGTFALGVGGRVAGDKAEHITTLTGGEFGAYAKVGVGFSW